MHYSINSKIKRRKKYQVQKNHINNNLSFNDNYDGRKKKKKMIQQYISRRNRKKKKKIQETVQQH